MLLQRCFTPNRVQVLSFPWVTDRFVTANMNAIKTQSYNPSYFLKGRFGEKVQCNHTQFLAGTQPLIEGPGDEVEFPSVLCSLTIAPGRPYWISRTFTTMISRLRLATKIGKCLFSFLKFTTLFMTLSVYTENRVVWLSQINDVTCKIGCNSKVHEPNIRRRYMFS